MFEAHFAFQVLNFSSLLSHKRTCLTFIVPALTNAVFEPNSKEISAILTGNSGTKVLFCSLNVMGEGCRQQTLVSSVEAEAKGTCLLKYWFDRLS